MTVEVETASKERSNIHSTASENMASLHAC